MMLPLLPFRPTTEIFAAVSLAGVAGLRLHTTWWRSPPIRYLALASFVVPALGFVAWRSGMGRLPPFGVVVAWTSVLVLAPLAGALVLSGLARRFLALFAAPSPVAPARTKAGALTRRALLEGAAASLPIASLATSATGLAAGAAEARMPVVKMRFADLPAALHGVRILHLTDLHLGVCLSSKDLERTLVAAERAGIDLLVLTGDIADDLVELEEALRLAHLHRPRLGVYAALGNHEYLRGIDAVLATFQRGEVPLLVDAGTTLEVDGAKLFIAGADDPEGGSSLDTSVADCASSAPHGAFKLLLCHRPRGFRAAAKHGFDLTLSGHTHGGQVGIGGRSVFELLWPGTFLWGDYQIKKSKLYTSSGFGHWFPFRLGCPTEAPIIVLERA